jgi:regulatory protein
MKITAIKAQVKSDSRVSVFLDGKYSFSLTLDQLLDLKLKKGLEVDDGQAKQFKKLSDEGKLKQRALEWLMGRPHSTREFRDYLYRKQAEKDLIEAWAEEFTAKGYLNDADFARWFADVRRRKNKSARAITAELFSKGVAPATIQNIISELEISDDSKKSETEALNDLMTKLKGRSRYQDQQKLIAYLISKGFKYSDIKEALTVNSEQ